MKINKILHTSQFTLIELIVVLGIMAGLLTITTVSVSSVQEKNRAEKTQRIGEGILKDIQKNDGLSFISDFGRLPNTSDEVKYMFFKTVNANTAAVYNMENLPNLPNSTPNALTVAASAQVAGKTMGVGWRGPYSSSEGVESDESFQDGWGSDIVFDFTSGELDKIISYGRDGVVEGSTKWQDKDREFVIHKNLINNNIDLTISLFYMNAGIKTVALFADMSVIYFVPRFPAHFATNTIGYAFFDYNVNWNTTYNPAGYSESIAGTQSNFTIDNLNIGRRKIFFYGSPDGGTTNYSSQVITLNLNPGSNNLEIILEELP